jgi:hypothetical protein
MKTFTQWLQEYYSTIDKPSEIAQVFQGWGDGIKKAGQAKNLEYAKRIIAGEKPEVVMDGIRVNGVMWNSVMDLVQQLKSS